MASLPAGELNPSDFRARSYQLEMFEASLKRNIIVAMGTGSGKTHIALLRITWELENADASKLIWFLAPTVALCLQQHRVISQHLPTARTRTLTGLDKVEFWTEQAIWDAVLDGTQVVVSTPAVLLDAMTHGFVRISRLGLIIFDEAHHCTRNHPANKIMGLFYHPTVREYGTAAAPKILGLTASAAGDLEALRTVEKNLASTCMTPQAHRHELLQHTNKPELRRIWYTPLVADGAWLFGPTQKALIETCRTLKLEDDPYVKKLRVNPSDGAALQKVLQSGDTYCNDQLKKFVARVVHIHQELGVWAAEYFIWASTEQLRCRIHDTSSMDLDVDERKYLSNILSRLPAPDLNTKSNNLADFPISPKFEALISFLLSTEKHRFSGLIFVQQRTTVAVLAHLLSVHPLTRHRFKTGGFVGMSNSTKRKDMLGDLLATKMQRDTLDDFRYGRKNLIVATDVLEEGIDVSACSVVVCYDKPQTLKSYVQRRGRARRRHSTYAMVLSTEEDDHVLKKWENVEEVMEKAYKEDRRNVEEAKALEDLDEDVHARFRIASTGAILTADNAIAHLYHFCAILPRKGGINMMPEFSFQRHEGNMIKGKVTLPSCVIPAVRQAVGKSWWKTERAARKEAAFEAYKALHGHGLVNDNLLPLTKSRDFALQDPESLPAVVVVSKQYDPWRDLADAWAAPDLHHCRIAIRRNGEVTQMSLVTPAPVPCLEPLDLNWDADTTFRAEFGPAEPVSLNAGSVNNMRAITALYLQAASRMAIPPERDYVALFAPDIPPEELGPWLEKNRGHQLASKVWANQRSSNPMGIVRNNDSFGELLLFKRWIHQGNKLELECGRYPRRRNLLWPVVPVKKQTRDDEDPPKPTPRLIISAENSTIDKLPAEEAIFSRFIAVILSRLTVALIASELCNTILRQIPFTNLKHIITAMTTPIALEPTDYQRYEFFGDSVLKFTVASQLYYARPNWHEGYLTHALHALVQNGRLAKAALRLGLDKFIITEVFVARKWKAPLISNNYIDSDSTRPMARKALADVVEALIGAAYVDGGHERACAVIDLFLPEAQLNSHTDSDTDVDTPMSNTESPCSAVDQMNYNTSHPRLINHGSLESAIGYKFRNDSLLLEALTHPSCNRDVSTQSYQRLEFLGDAVLDMLIVETMQSHPRELSAHQMSRVKAALVNGDLLGFLCLEFAWAGDSLPPTRTDGEVEQMQSTMHLYSYLRHSSELMLTQMQTHSATTTALTRHMRLRDQILSALETGKAFPHSALAAVHPNKAFSDIIESILGAIYVDSGSDLTPCRGFIERLGLLAYANRVLDGAIDVIHPIERASASLARHASRVSAEAKSQNGNEGKKDRPWRFRLKSFRVTGTGEREELPTVDDPDLDTNPGDYPDNATGAYTPGEKRGGEAEADAEQESQELIHGCTISLAGLGLGRDKVTVTGCISRDEAEIRAAMAVLEILEDVEIRPGKWAKRKLDQDLGLAHDPVRDNNVPIAEGDVELQIKGRNRCLGDW
ncbi:hypothetical protein BDW69DRAFT_170234 [Aspergillus filifer]